MSSEPYSELRLAPIRATISLLQHRIEERFPSSGLSRLAAELLSVAEQNEAIIAQLRRPLPWVRAMTFLAIGALVVLVLWAVVQVVRITAGGVVTVADLLQAIDAATSELIFLSIVVLFLASLENRLKRRIALRMLHRLRSIAHVVDMHQLTKDPSYVLQPVAATVSSPARTLTREQLARYLDYCSELLALTSKLAAVHAQHLQDPVLLDAVNDIESLTAGLSRKVWQKISILNASHGSESAASAPPA